MAKKEKRPTKSGKSKGKGEKKKEEKK